MIEVPLEPIALHSSQATKEAEKSDKAPEKVPGDVPDPMGGT